jgi:hypothetical protein
VVRNCEDLCDLCPLLERKKKKPVSFREQWLQWHALQLPKPTAALTQPPTRTTAANLPAPACEFTGNWEEDDDASLHALKRQTR